MSSACVHCGKRFTPSVYHPHQKVCGLPECRRKHRREYHRQKRATDPDYRKTCQDSQAKWRANNPGYDQRYRESHPEAVERNRAKQRTRDAIRRLKQALPTAAGGVEVRRVAGPVWLVVGGGNLAKNNLAFAQPHGFVEVVTAGARAPLAKNNLASGYPIAGEAYGVGARPLPASCKEQPSGGGPAAGV